MHIQRLCNSFALVLLPLLRLARAQTADFDVFSLTPNYTVEAGTKFDIRWYPSPAPLDGPFSISLIHGSQGSLKAPATLLGSNITAPSPTDGKWTWTVPGPADWTAEEYASPVFVFRINLDSDNSIYSLSLPFNISGIVLVDSTGTTTSSTSATSQTTASSGSNTSPTASQTSGTSTTSNAALSATSTPTNSASGAPSASSSGLSTGAKAGIAIGAVLIVALIGGLIFFFLRRRRQSRYQTSSQLPSQTPPASLPPDSEPGTATSALSPDSWLLDFASDAAEKDTVWREGVGQNGMHELDASKASEIPVEADSTQIAKRDIGGKGVPSLVVTSPKATPAGTNGVVPLPGIGYSSSDPAADLADVESDRKLDVLQTRLEKVRSAKEKLKNLPELEELERELKEEVMKEQRRKMSTGSATGGG